MSVYCVADMSTKVSMLTCKSGPITGQHSCASSVNTNAPLVPELPVQTTTCTTNCSYSQPQFAVYLVIY